MVRQRVHELTPRGIKSAKAWLGALRSGVDIPLSSDILTAPSYAKPVHPEIYVEDVEFKTRRDAGLYLVRRLAPMGEARVIDNAYLWSWLGMFYFDKLVRKDSDGNIRLGRMPDIAYVIDPDASGESWGESRRYANRLMLAYDIYRQHGEDAWFMLQEPVTSLGRFTLRLASAPELFRSRGIVKLAQLLYPDPETLEMKDGWTGETRATAPPGSMLRLIDVLKQLYMTYDVYGMTAEQLLPLLPSEFDRFKPTQ